MLTHEASSIETSSIETCSVRSPIMPQIVGNSDFESTADTAGFPSPAEYFPSGFHGSSIDSSFINTGTLSPPVKQDPLHHSHGRLSPQQTSDPACIEPAAAAKLLVIHTDCAFSMEGKQDDCSVGEECGLDKQVKHDVTCDMPCGEQQKDCRSARVDDTDKTVIVPGDVNVRTSEMEKLSVNAREAHGRQGQALTINEAVENVSQAMLPDSNGDVLDSSNKKQREEKLPLTPPPCRPAAWRTPEPTARRMPEPIARRTPEPVARISSESEFAMESTEWPTLAEARHSKPSEARVSPCHKETVVAVSTPAQQVPSSQVANLQEAPVEAPRHAHTNPPQQGPRYRPSYRKNNVPGYNKPSFPATENTPIPPMGVHVPSANMFNADQSRKRNGFSGSSNFSPVPHQQAPANGPYYHNRGEGLAPFPHNPLPPYARGHPGWQHGRGYNHANYKHSGFVPAYDQQYFGGPRPLHPPMAPFVNINVTQYNYANFPTSDMSYMPAPGYSYAPTYFGPSGPPAGAMQGLDVQTLLMMLQRQIEYYFSKENLIRDIFLTSKMDEEGFVPISLIASFPRVRSLTSNTALIFEALKNSSIVELKNGKLRSREWRRQLLVPSQTTGQSFAPSVSKTGMDLARDQKTTETLELRDGRSVGLC